MNTSQSRGSTISKQKDYLIRSRWGRVSMLIGLGLLGYYGYCFGFWGRNSLFLQYLFQCNCPGFSEEWRYPKEVDVIVSACNYDDVILSPSGRLLYVQNDRSNSTVPNYVLNLQTNEKTPLTLADGSNYFLTDELIFHSFHGNDDYILDLTTGLKYPLQDATQLQPSIYHMGNVEPTLLLKALSQIDQIFFIDDLFQPVVALPSDFRTRPGNSFNFSSSDFHADDTRPAEKFLIQNYIAYHYVPGSSSIEVLSPDGRFIARRDGIYLINTEQFVVETQYSQLKGWIYDGRGAIYTGTDCLFMLSLPGLDMSCLVWVPQPVILIKVPEEYLSSPPASWEVVNK